jgi:hypothetical protein
MLRIVSLLKQSKFFTDIEVLELVNEEAVQALKVKATVKGASVLYITELHTSESQKYSYHWQKENGDVIIRWDNAPHYKGLKTFPHHRHEGNRVFPSHRITIEEVIATIKIL